MYDFLIVGGGISGLYIIYELLKKNKKLSICLCESTNRLGGRIYTDYLENDIRLEAGAGRFNHKHSLFLNLLKELNLDHKKFEINGHVQYISSKGKRTSKTPFELLDKVFQKNTMKKSELQNLTFMEFASLYLTEKEVKFLTNSFGYYKQLVDMNAYDAIKLFKDGMHCKNTFYTLQGGMSQVVEKLKSKCVGKCEIKMNTSIKNLLHSDQHMVTVETNHGIIKAKKCVMTIPAYNLKDIKFFQERFDFNAVGTKELCRIYAKFDECWFRHIKKTTTNSDMRYIIPIDYDKSIIMISYTDSKFAKEWLKLTKKEIIQKLRKEIKNIFNIHMPSPTLLKMYYWNVGVTYWKKNYDSTKLSKEIATITDSVYVCGESFSTRQCWIEGALETCQHTLSNV